MAAWKWTDGTTTVDFATAFGCLPQVSITREPQHDDATGDRIRVRYVITIRGTIRAEGADTPTRQADITDKLDTLLSFTDGTATSPTSLWFEDNTPTESFGLDRSTATINVNTITGLKVGQHDLPFRPADWVTNKQYTVTFFADVYECTDKPLPGTSGTYGTRVNYDRGGIATIVYSGMICPCDAVDIDVKLDILVETVLTPDAIRRADEAGLEVGENFGPETVEVEEVGKCRRFTVRYGSTGGAGGGSSASKLTVRARRHTEQNRIILTITGTYSFKGAPSAGGWPVIVSLPGSGGPAPGSFEAVSEEAERFAGIRKENFYPKVGRGLAFLLATEDLDFDLDGRTISATRVYELRWRHDTDLVDYRASVLISNSRPGFADHRLTLKKAQVGAAGGGAGGAAPTPTTVPLAYFQRSGHAAWRVTVQIDLVSISEHKDIESFLEEDGVNVIRIDPDSARVPSRRVNVHKGQALEGGGGGSGGGVVVVPPGGSGGGKIENYAEYVTSMTQTFAVRDIEVGPLKNIRVGTVEDVASVAALGAAAYVPKIIKSGSATGSGGVV